MALAGPAHILLPAQHQLDRLVQPEGGQSGQGGPGGGLILLAAKGAAETENIHLDLVHGQAEHARHAALYGCRRLGG